LEILIENALWIIVLSKAKVMQTNISHRGKFLCSREMFLEDIINRVFFERQGFAGIACQGFQYSDDFQQIIYQALSLLGTPKSIYLF